MNKQEAVYFLEGFIAGLAAPSTEMAKHLFALVAFQFGITGCELTVVRKEIDLYLDIAEQSDEQETAQ